MCVHEDLDLDVDLMQSRFSPPHSRIRIRSTILRIQRHDQCRVGTLAILLTDSKRRHTFTFHTPRFGTISRLSSFGNSIVLYSALTNLRSRENNLNLVISLASIIYELLDHGELSIS